MIIKQGVHKTNMIEIADEAEVSRATLYNHFRDKESVLRALLESEVDRILECARGQSNPGIAMAKLAIEISTDQVLAKMRDTDPALLARLATVLPDPLWARIKVGLEDLAPGSSEMALRWLLGQCFAPINAVQAQFQAQTLTR